MNKYKFVTDQITFKSQGEEYFVEGYISSSNVDLVGDICTESCMQDMVKQIKEGKIKLDVEHEAWTKGQNIIPVGMAVDAKYDPKTKRVWAKFKLNKHVKRFSEVWQSVKGGFLDAFSIAFIPVRATKKQMGDAMVRVLDGVRLMNVALTGNPANPDARMLPVMQKSLKSLPEEEDEMSEDPEMKFKYKRRYRGPGGKWYYEYNDPEEYDKRVRKYEDEGMDRSDAQATVDAEANREGRREEEHEKAKKVISGMSDQKLKEEYYSLAKQISELNPETGGFKEIMAGLQDKITMVIQERAKREKNGGKTNQSRKDEWIKNPLAPNNEYNAITGETRDIKPQKKAKEEDNMSEEEKKPTEEPEAETAPEAEKPAEPEPKKENPEVKSLQDHVAKLEAELKNVKAEAKKEIEAQLKSFREALEAPQLKSTIAKDEAPKPAARPRTPLSMI